MAPFENCSIFKSVEHHLLPAFPRKETLNRQITNAGGTLATSPITATHIIVHNMQQVDLPRFLLSKSTPLCSIVWYFACIESGKLLSPDAHAIYRPFPSPCIPGAAEFGVVTITGFSGMDRTAVWSFIQAAGLKYSGDLNVNAPGRGPDEGPLTALLIAKDVDATSSAKLDAAREYHVPVVNMRWILDCLDKWTLLPTSGYTEAADVSLELPWKVPRGGPLAVFSVPRVGIVLDSEEEEEEEAVEKNEDAVEEAAAAQVVEEEQAVEQEQEAVQEPEAIVEEEEALAEEAAVDEEQEVEEDVGQAQEEPAKEADLSIDAEKAHDEPSPSENGAAPIESLRPAPISSGITDAGPSAAAPAAATNARPGSASTMQPSSGKVGFGSEFSAPGGGATQAMGVIGGIADALLFQETEVELPGQGHHALRLASAAPPPPLAAAAPAAAAAAGPAAVAEEERKEEDNNDGDDGTPTPSELSLDNLNFTAKNKSIEEHEEDEEAPTPTAAAEENDDADEFQGQNSFLPPTEIAHLPLTEAMPEFIENNDDDDGDDDVNEYLEDAAPVDEPSEPVAMEEEEKQEEQAEAEIEEEESEKKPEEKEEEKSLMKPKAGRGRKRKTTPPVTVPEKKIEEEIEPQQKRTRGRKQPSPSRAPSSQPELPQEKAEKPQEKRTKRTFLPGKKVIVAEEEAPKRTRQARSAAKPPAPAPPAPAAAAAAAPAPPPEATKAKKKPTPTPAPPTRKLPKSSSKPPAPQNPVSTKRSKKEPQASTSKAPPPVVPSAAKQKSQKSQKGQAQAHIALSGMHTAEQKQMVEKFSKVKNVEITTSLSNDYKHDWQPEFTHIVAPSLLRNQKCLAALAAGAWIVGPDFATACQKAGKVVDAEPFELEQPVAAANNETSKKSKKSNPGTADELIEAGVARFWRLQRNKSGDGAFNGLCFTIAARGLDEPPSKDDLAAIIQAGGGALVPLSQQADIIIAGANSAVSSISVQKQVKGGALCVTSMYIVDWLAKPKSNLESHVVVGGDRKGEAVMAAEAIRATGQRPEPESSISL